MKKDIRHSTVDWLPASVMLTFGVVFFVTSLLTPPDYSGGRDSTMVPIAASATVVGLSLIELVLKFWGGHKRHLGSDEIDDSSHHVKLLVFCRYSAPLILLLAVYGIMFEMIGYLLSTMMVGFLAFWAFGNTIRQSLLHMAIGTAILYFIFIEVLGVYNPAGDFLNRITGMGWGFYGVS